MKNLFSLLLILFILGFFSVIDGQTTKRTAVIVDQSETSTELKSLGIGIGQPAKYYKPISKLVVITETFDVLIPDANLISIEYIGDGIKNKRIFDVSYYWMGEKKMISGNLVDLQLTGQSDFGGFSISSNELKQLRFSQISDKIKQEEEFNSDGYITLRDGTKLEFGERSIGWTEYTLKRHVSHLVRHKKTLPQNATDMMLEQHRYEWVNEMYNSYNKSIAFDRGKSQGLVEFKDLKSIEFEGENNRDIIITLKNGKSTEAQINESKDYRDFDGLVGVSEKGEFYIERKNIRIVHFY